MLSAEENELLTRVGPGTPMGNLLRCYWLPVLFSWEVTVDGPPDRVRLLGEDLIAFRDTDGRVGLLENHCPHRGASLFFGRNEECGLRCVYHGWKFDISGQCVDMPNEPAESNFKHKIRTTAYPCAEQGGVVWVYMGSASPPPPLPEPEWTMLPAEHRFMGTRVQDCNWLQALEGELDQSHVSFVHSALNPIETAGGSADPSANVSLIRSADKHPHFETLDTGYGIAIGSGRVAGAGRKYWRVTQYLLPFFAMTGPYGPNPTRNWRAWVPIDDEHVFVLGTTFHPTRPLSAQEQERLATRSSVFTISPQFRAPPTTAPFGRWRSNATLANDFGIDRTVQRTKTYSGIPEFWGQDAGPQVSMGPIFDRTKEHLGTSDLGIIAVRQRLLRETRALLERGVPPASAANPAWYRVRAAAVLIPEHQSWVEATAEHRKILVGINQDAV